MKMCIETPSPRHRMSETRCFNNDQSLAIARLIFNNLLRVLFVGGDSRDHKIFDYHYSHAM